MTQDTMGACRDQPAAAAVAATRSIRCNYIGTFQAYIVGLYRAVDKRMIRGPAFAHWNPQTT